MTEILRDEPRIAAVRAEDVCVAEDLVRENERADEEQLRERMEEERSPFPPRHARGRQARTQDPCRGGDRGTRGKDDDGFEDRSKHVRVHVFEIVRFEAPRIPPFGARSGRAETRTRISSPDAAAGSRWISSTTASP